VVSKFQGLDDVEKPHKNPRNLKGTEGEGNREETKSP
jgi:hypothetical protein